MVNRCDGKVVVAEGQLKPQKFFFKLTKKEKDGCIANCVCTVVGRIESLDDEWYIVNENDWRFNKHFDKFTRYVDLYAEHYLFKSPRIVFNYLKRWLEEDRNNK